jgi:uncharacterized membrane protein
VRSVAKRLLVSLYVVYNEDMSTKATIVIMLVGIIVAFSMGALLYPLLPAEMVSHWNAVGEPDSTVPKTLGVLLLPVFLVGVFLLYIVLPKIDPLGGNIEWFQSHYNMLWAILFLFLLYVHLLVLLWNAGYSFNITMVITPGLAILLYGIGATMEHAKRNWFVGIRTPWTLSDDVVWEKTHLLGGRLFKISAVLAFAGLLFSDSVFALIGITVPAVGITVITFVYSYFAYRARHGVGSSPNLK